MVTKWLNSVAKTSNSSNISRFKEELRNFAKLSTAVVVAVILGIKIFLDRGKPLLPQAIPMISLIFCGIALAILMPRGSAGNFFAFPHLSTSAIKLLAERLMSPNGLLPHVLICLISIKINLAFISYIF